MNSLLRSGRYRLSVCSPSIHVRLQSTFHRPLGLPKPPLSGLYNRDKSTTQKNLVKDSIKISEEVLEAARTRKPVVALETTIYTHGYPYPDNVQLALDLEDIVRKNGGIPATIGILNGVAHIGLSKDELTELASKAGDPETRKVSRRDIPFMLGMGIAGRKMSGGTTISGTIFLAHQAKIMVLGTGGLGGVHRGGQDSMDISADLTELGRTRFAVISSGCKSFLDIPRTLEYLETQGAGVFTFADGRTGAIDYPSFYTRDSGILSPMVVQNEKEAASIIFSSSAFARTSGFHFANPIPEEFSIPKSEIDDAIDQAVEEAAEQGYHGHANTPFILSRIKELTQGTSVVANRALIESNVKVATKVSVELQKLRIEYGRDSASNPGASSNKDTVAFRRKGELQSRKDNALSSNLQTPKQTPRIVVVGSVAVDLSCDYKLHPTNPSTSPVMHTSNIGDIRTSIGGVGYNVALAAQLSSNDPVSLCSIIVDDQPGKSILQTLESRGLNTDHLVKLPVTSTQRTAQYVAINDSKKDLVVAIADMSIFSHSSSSSPAITSILKTLRALPHTVQWVILDANFHPEALHSFLRVLHTLRHTTHPHLQVAYEPVSIPKSTSLFAELPDKTHIDTLPLFPHSTITLATPNIHELIAMHNLASERELFSSPAYFSLLDTFGIPSSGARDRFVQLTSKSLTDEGIPFRTIQLLPFLPRILTKLGKDGVLLTQILRPGDSKLRDPEHARFILSHGHPGSEVGGVYMRLFPAVETVGEEEVVSVNGVGDTFLGVLVAGLARGVELGEELIGIAQRGAVLTLRSRESVAREVEGLRGVLDGMVEEKAE